MTDAQTLLQEGLSAFRARAYDRALQAWRALLDAEPDNQQVKQLVERTEALAAEGHLVHTLKEELADLREELATTRQARNDLLIEMARVHKRYQAREARLWKLQEEREWELREALAHAELSSLVGDDHHAPQALLTPAPAPETLDDALDEIQNLLNALNQAQQRIQTLESSGPTPSDHNEDPHLDSTHDAPQSESEEIEGGTDEDDTPATKRPETRTRPSRTVPAKTGGMEFERSPTSDIDIPHKSSSKHTQTSRTLAGARQLFEPESTHEPDQDDESLSFDGPLIADEWLNTPETTDQKPSVSDDLVSLVQVVSKNGPRKTDPVSERPSDSIEDADEVESTEIYPVEDAFSTDAVHSDDLSLLQTDDEADSDQTSANKPAALLDGLTDASEASDAAAAQDTAAKTDDEAHQPSDNAPFLSIDTDEAFQIEDDPEDVFQPKDDPRSASDANLATVQDSDDASDTSDPVATPDEEHPAPAPAPADSDDSSPEVQSRSNIPDTARIDAQPMEDKDIADGFSDELTSALGSTPAPQRLFTGVQPDLPDIDIFEDEPQVMAPEDLEKYPTAVPVRYKDDPSIDDPIARYLLTHVDGVSTFMELRGTVGLPPAAVDRGFRILLAHKVIRVQHQ